MAADCKSATLFELRRFESSPVLRSEVEVREEPGAVVDAEFGREDLERSGNDLDRKF